MGAWNGWYHITVGTYGTWLPGDERGWRSRHHRQHVDGDYKKPPAEGKYDSLKGSSQSRLTNAAVLLTPDQRRIAGQAMVEGQWAGAAIPEDNSRKYYDRRILVSSRGGARQQTGRAKGNVGLCLPARHGPDCGASPSPRVTAGWLLPPCARTRRHRILPSSPL